MVKRIVPFIVVLLLISSCGNKGGKATSVNSTSENPVNVQFASLVEDPGKYIGKEIVVVGKVVEVCPHTGKKMFITGDNPNLMLYIAADKNTPEFSAELLGTKIAVEGKLVKATAAENPAAEKSDSTMTEGGCCSSGAKGGMNCNDSTKMAKEKCATEAALAGQPVLADLMMIYNKHTTVK